MDLKQKEQEQKIDNIQLSSISTQRTQQDQVYTTFNEYINRVRKVNDKKRKQVVDLLNELISTNLKIIPYKQISQKQTRTIFNNQEIVVWTTNYNDQRVEQLTKMKLDLTDISQLRQSMFQSRDQLIHELTKVNDKLSQLKQKASKTQYAINQLNQEALSLNKLNLNLYTQIYEKKIIKSQLSDYTKDKQKREKTNFKQLLRNLFVKRQERKLAVETMQKCRSQLQKLINNGLNRKEECEILDFQINDTQKRGDLLSKQYQDQYNKYQHLIQAKQERITQNSLLYAEQISFKYDAKIKQYARCCTDIIEVIKLKYPNHKLPSLDSLIMEMKKNLYEKQISSHSLSNISSHQYNNFNFIIQEEQIESSRKDQRSNLYEN